MLKENIEMKEWNKENRQCFLDFLRVAATCAVVLLHTITGVTDTRDMSLYPVEKTVFLVGMDLVTWCVPVFIMISGMLFLDSRKKLTWHTMLGKYCRRILLALFCFGVPYALLELLVEQRSFRISMLWDSVWRVCTGHSWSHMWYLYLIFLLYLLTPLLRRGLFQMPKGAIYFVLAVIALGSSIFPFLKKAFGLSGLPVLPDEGIYFFYYIWGYLFSGRTRPLKRGERRLAQGSVLALAAGMVLSRLIGNYSVQMAYNYPFTVALSLLLMVLAREGENTLRQKNTALFRRTGELCFAVYLVHPVFLNLLYKFMGITPLNLFERLSIPIGLPLSLMLSFVMIYGLALAGSFITAFLLHKIPLLHRYVL
ncbi:MAG: acyltransferase [Roseburia sp.]|nr:acyltransferase [Roseburia sp.]